MASLDTLRNLVESTLVEHTRVPAAYGQIQFELVFDRVRDRYLLMLVGWDHRGQRVHGSLIHIDIIEGKIWIQRDGTEEGVANELLAAGVAEEQVVLAWKSPETDKQAQAAVA